MKITVKVFQGQETTLEVSGQTSVKELKHYVSETLKVPVSQQKLLFTGKPLSDEKCLLDYPLIKDGTKINLVVKKTDEENVLRNAVINFLRPTFNEAQTQKIADEFMKFLFALFRLLQPVDLPGVILNSFGLPLARYTNRHAAATRWEFYRSMSTLNLEDIERIATSFYSEDDFS